MYFFLYDNTTGIIQQPPMQATSNPWPNPPSSWSVASFATTDTTAILAAANPAWYLIQDTTPTLVLQSYWTATTSVSSGTTTITATLNNPPSSPPTSATLAVAGGTMTASISSNQATFTVAVHPSVAAYQIPATVSASGTVSGSVNLGGNAASPIGLQLYQGSSGNWHVAPGGTGSTYYLMGYHAAQINQAAQVNSLAVAVGELLHLVHDKIVPSLQSSSYTALSLSADETNALNDITTNVLPDIVPTLGVLYPSGGSPMPIYAQMKATMSAIQTAMGDTNTALTDIPNLG